jgi:hypothetical protein
MQEVDGGERGPDAFTLLAMEEATAGCKRCSKEI